MLHSHEQRQRLVNWGVSQSQRCHHPATIPPPLEATMPAITPQYISHDYALPCHTCGTMTAISRLEPRADGRYQLVPVCDEHRQTRNDPANRR